ncbi:hypothetical protein SAMN05421688_1417 [Poseidonocella pacifica]|uniref:Uncharacterized protein n=1 Tax=Poseidonocella pacifica TaxID=871651 RepID=A0A1I0WGH8_9RHOB|nr:hypothetical protein [Poseidonocella pacifica]SFA87852.1 hypothetical protein SAMN05421688_1417 [Poseidonocella pacifica]
MQCSSLLPLVGALAAMATGVGAATLTNGVDDGSVIIEVDEYGTFGTWAIGREGDGDGDDSIVPLAIAIFPRCSQFSIR